jgi:hypothetical protein
MRPVHRPGQEEALSEVATERPQPGQVLLGLDALGDCPEAGDPAAPAATAER